MSNWDNYFYGICQQVTKNSKCLSRNIGAILVRDKVIVATGYNGPPRGMAHCNTRSGLDQCPRRFFGYGSGEGLHLCPAAHAEANCIANAARVGVNTKDTTIYMTCEIPCNNCLALIINAGISEVVCKSITPYDDLSVEILEQSSLTLRSFNGD